MKAIDAVRRWWQGRHPVLPISHYEPARPREQGAIRDRSATTSPFRARRRRAHNRARARSHAAGQYPSYPSRR